MIVGAAVEIPIPPPGQSQPHTKNLERLVCIKLKIQMIVCNLTNLPFVRMVLIVLALFSFQTKDLHQFLNVSENLWGTGRRR